MAINKVWIGLTIAALLKTFRTRFQLILPVHSLGMWEVGVIKIECTRARYIFLCVCMDICEKVFVFLVKSSVPENFWRGNFFGASTHGILTHSGFRKYNRFGWPTSSYTNLDQIPKFKISTKHQHFDQTLTSKSWPNIHFITSPSLSSKILTILQFQNFAWTSTSNSWPNLVLKVWTKFSFMTKLHLPNLHKTVVKTFLIINISNSNKLNKFWVGIFTSHTSHQSSLLNRSEWVSESVSYWQGWTMIRLRSDKN